MQPPPPPSSGALSARPVQLGRYVLYEAIAAGGMATVHIGRLQGAVGFSRTVAIKRLHEHLARDPEFAQMFLDEARLAARIRHPNVVPTLDVVSTQGQLFVVMEFVQGESFSRLLKVSAERRRLAPPPVVVTILCSALEGLHAAHEATGDHGEPLHLVHRDVSPQNILVGTDGVARVVDFGVAKAAGRVQETRAGQMKGKLAYMAPEQISGAPIDRRTDVFAAGIVLWEALVGRRLYLGEHDGQTLAKVLAGGAPPPSSLVRGLPPSLDAVVMRALSPSPADRFASAREMAIVLGESAPSAQPFRVSEWVESLAGDGLAGRAIRVAEIESHSSALRNIGLPSPTATEVVSLAGSDVASVPSQPWPGTPVSGPPSAAPQPPPPPMPAAGAAPSSRKSILGAMAVAAGVFVFAAAVLALVALSRRNIWTGTYAPAGTDSAALTSSVAPPPGQPSPPASTAPSTAPTVLSIDDLAPAASATAGGHPPPVHFPSGPAVKPGCNPPYRIDSAGVRRYLPQCF